MRTQQRKVYCVYHKPDELSKEGVPKLCRMRCATSRRRLFCRQKDSNLILKIKNLGNSFTCPNYVDESGTVCVAGAPCPLPKLISKCAFCTGVIALFVHISESLHPLTLISPPWTIFRVLAPSCFHVPLGHVDRFWNVLSHFRKFGSCFRGVDAEVLLTFWFSQLRSSGCYAVVLPASSPLCCPEPNPLLKFRRLQH